MDAKTYKVMKSLSAICKVIWREQKVIDNYGDWSLSRETKQIMDTLKYLRSQSRDREYKETYKQREERLTRAAINSMYQNSRKTVYSSIKRPISFSAYQATASKWEYTIKVGWGWRRHVYSKFYDKGNLDAHHFFVMTAEEVRVNHPHIKLYEVQAGDFKEGKIVTMFVGQTTIGECEAAIKETSSEAIRAAKALFEKQINNDLRRRNEDDQR